MNGISDFLNFISKTGNLMQDYFLNLDLVIADIKNTEQLVEIIKLLIILLLK